MTKDDEAAVDAQIAGIKASSPMLEYHQPVSIGNGVSKEAMMLGVSPQYKDVRNLAVIAGRFFDDQDDRSHSKVGVLVEPFARTLFGSINEAVGKKSRSKAYRLPLSAFLSRA